MNRRRPSQRAACPLSPPLSSPRSSLAALCLLAALVVVPLGCSGAEQPGSTPELRAVGATGVGRKRARLGVPVKGFPSWGERLIAVMTNRMRADPAAEIAAVCPTTCAGNYAVGKPLAYDYNLNRSARFHSTLLRKAGAGLQHESVCKLKAGFAAAYPDQCDGSPSCACEGGAASCTCRGGKPFCTCNGASCASAAQRVFAFGSGYSGENAAAGNSDPIRTYQQWVRSSGHRGNMLNTRHGKLGVGGYSGSGACWGSYWVQNFTYARPPSPPALVAGAHYPLAGASATAFDFWVNHYDAAGAAPQLASVNVEGRCYAMSRERGQVGNATYHVKTALPISGCLRYYFYFKDASGVVKTFPEVGSFTVGVGSTSCENYDATTRPAPGAGCGAVTADGGTARDSGVSPRPDVAGPRLDAGRGDVRVGPGAVDAGFGSRSDAGSANRGDVGPGGGGGRDAGANDSGIGANLLTGRLFGGCAAGGASSPGEHGAAPPTLALLLLTLLLQLLVRARKKRPKN